MIITLLLSIATIAILWRTDPPHFTTTRVAEEDVSDESEELLTAPVIDEQQSLIDHDRLLQLELAQMKAEREARRIEREQAEAWKKQQAWNAKQEYINSAIDKRICDLEFKVKQADSAIEHLNTRLDDLNESLEKANKDALAFRKAGDEDKEEKAKRKIMTLRNQIHSAEDQLAKAEHAKEMAELELAVA